MCKSIYPTICRGIQGNTVSADHGNDNGGKTEVEGIGLNWVGSVAVAADGLFFHTIFLSSSSTAKVGKENFIQGPSLP